jgi:hypothetical protein
MQGLVRRHFYRSLLEAERQANPFRSRYNWRVRGRTICVWLPVSLVGRERREWLEKNIDNPNPFREGERERVQAIVYSKLVRERSVDYTEDTDNSSEEKNLNGDDSGEIFTTSLAEVIAKEKARNIQLQRRSIKALGEERLRQLILRIFENLNCGEYEDGKVARDFGIAKATFSRFAGSRWFQKASAIPDLWRNTAEVLSENPIFEEVAKSAGVWEEVQNTLKMGDLQKGGESQPCLKTCIFYLK